MGGAGGHRCGGAALDQSAPGKSRRSLSGRPDGELIELLRSGKVGRGELDVVDLAIVIGVRHGRACGGGEARC